MGKIIKNGKEYKFGTSVGFQTGGDTIEILTQAEYDELVAAGATDDDIYYFIEDEKNGGVLVNASNVSYDNSESGMAATDIQGAVDEVNGKVDEISTDVTELNQNFQDGVNTIVSAVNTKAGTALTGANTPTEIADVIKNIKTDISFVATAAMNSTRQDDYYGQYSHRHVFNLSSIPNIESMKINKDFFVCLNGIRTGQDPSTNQWLTCTYDGKSGAEVYYKANNYVGLLGAIVYYNENFTP